jgi:hypothetical protein
VWVFFAQAIQAAQARRLGSALLTHTTAQRHEVGLDSYDRLFPGQNTLPKGGFGNLIALPLQRQPRDEGKSVFAEGAHRSSDSRPERHHIGNWFDKTVGNECVAGRQRRSAP